MSFDYEKSIWGASKAKLGWSEPTDTRLRRLLKAFNNLNAASRVLEVGCGAGSFIRALKTQRPELNCFGTDISREAISRAQSQDNSVVYNVCSDNSLPYEDGFFDGIFLIDVLEHVSWPENLLLEINRVLKTGGTLFIFVPCEGDFLSFWNLLNIFGLKQNVTKIFAGHVNNFSRSDISRLMNVSGFLITRKSYAEHLFGQVVGIASFFAMRNKQKKSGGKFNNEEFFAEFSAGRGELFSLFKRAINGLVVLESKLFSWLPSPNVFIKAVKK